MPHSAPASPRSNPTFFSRLWIGALCLALIVGATRRADANEEAAALAAAELGRVQELVDAMRLELAVSHEVSVELVTANPLKASVAPVKGAAGTFRLSIEQSFLEQLTPVELKAVIAHELGHVWIYTHHPYLQTEQLANQIALRVVSRESLDSVYGKVWPDAAAQGSLPRFPETRAAELGASDPRD
jgi:Zn-dependent protease with chaperone function